jgi:hypothetical protein
MPREPLTIGVPGDDGKPTTRETAGYLLEAHSWGGQSGSPVFVTATRGHLHRTFPWEGASSPVVLGLIQGHFDIDLAAMPTDPAAYGPDPADDTAPEYLVRVNSGIAVVIPAAEIACLLDRADVARERGGDLAS